MLRFLHTSDWQIGKVFRFLDSTMMALLQEARLRVIARIGELAAAHGAAHVIVAGDVYDMEALSPRSLIQPLERMPNFSSVRCTCFPAIMIHIARTGYGISFCARACPTTCMFTLWRRRRPLIGPRVSILRTRPTSRCNAATESITGIWSG